MPNVTGKLTDVGGGHLGGKSPEVIFTLNEPNAKAGVLVPTEPLKVTPAADGTFTANLQSTVDMLDDGYYTVSVVWQNAPCRPARYDFPQWQLRVPSGGWAFSDLFGRPPTNTLMFYVSLEEPADPLPFSAWLKDDPTDPENPLNTGNLYIRSLV